MSTEFKSTLTENGPDLLVALQGTIDEDVVFPEVPAGKFQKITLDLQNVKSINSVGIREWLNWITPLAQNADFLLDNAPKAMVLQFNMVEGFLPQRAQVRSFYVPFYSESADQEENVLFRVGNEVFLKDGAVQMKYDAKEAKPGGVDDMEMDVTEAKYFQFLKRAT